MDLIMSDISTFKERVKKTIDKKGITPKASLLLFGLPEGFFGEREPVIPPAPERRSRQVRHYSPAQIESLINRFASDRDTICTDFTCVDVARRTGIPAKVLQDYFQNALREDFRSWRARKKIEAAQELLLENKSISVSVIGKALGFTDRSNFHHRFKALTGYTPLEWRDRD